ncbi:MAG: DUF1974 domain-containing protein, partial [Gammaproteobacteria bacterium]|nr:DUF1974 domain-containing protein [Gammaproteobacteria bacterium]
KLLLSPSAARDRLTNGVYLNKDPDDPLGSLEIALEKILQAEPIEAKLEKALKARFTPGNYASLIERGLQENLIDNTEAEILRDAAAATFKVISVDEFPPEGKAARQRPLKAAQAG